MKDISYIILQNFSKDLIERTLCKNLNINLEVTSYEYGLNIGHTGNSDLIINLYQAINAQRVKSGDTVMCLSYGSGVTIMGMILFV